MNASRIEGSARRRTLLGPAALACLLAVLVAAVAAPGLAQEVSPASEPSASVAQISVCTAIEERQPVGVSETFGPDVGRLYCFTDVRGAEGLTLTHVWIHEGTTRARVPLSIRGPRWRCWSSKQILPSWTGAWEVKVLDEEGRVLASSAFRVE